MEGSGREELGPCVRIPKWNEFQRYKDRTPPWIKLHRKLLDKLEWRLLSPPAAKLLIDLWMLAGETTDGVIHTETRRLAWRLRQETEETGVSLKELAAVGFIEVYNMDLCASCASVVQGVCTEERRGEVSESTNPSTTSQDSPTQSAGGFLNGARGAAAKGGRKPAKRGQGKPKGPDTWLTPFGDLWQEKFGGDPNFGAMAQALKPHVDRHGAEKVLEVWRYYLAHEDERYASPHGMTKKFTYWLKESRGSFRGYAE